MSPRAASGAEWRRGKPTVGRSRLPVRLALKRRAMTARAGMRVDRATKLDLSKVPTINPWMLHCRQQGIEQERRANEEAGAEGDRGEFSAPAWAVSTASRPETRRYGPSSWSLNPGRPVVRRK